MTKTILIVDDDPVHRRLVEAAVQRFGHHTLTATDGRDGLEKLDADRSIATVLLDLAMPGMGGLDVMRAMAERGMTTPVIVQTAQGSIDTAVTAMRLGAFDFVVKPAPPEKLKASIANALKLGTIASKAGGKSSRLDESAEGMEHLFRSTAMAAAGRLARKASATDMPILIEGESGVGKEVIARAIGSAGPRRDGPFVTVNCGAIPENLVESILFGHEKGAFTGATERHTGKFVEADGGTLFLDEVGELPLDAQVKLLRAVQEGEVDPVGARQTVRVDIRLISATNRDLLSRVHQGLFREDLYYRLNVLPLRVPPLRERNEEIAELVETFIGQANASIDTGVTGIAPAALQQLRAYDWPGNVRQLQNAVFRACVLTEGRTLQLEDFPQLAPSIAAPLERQQVVSGISATAAVPSVPAYDHEGEVRSLAEIEQEMIRLAVEHYDGRLSEVARRLGIGRSTLYRKLKEMGLDVDEGRGFRRLTG